VTGLGVILRPVSFIFDPVPRVDRIRKPPEEFYGLTPAAWFESVEWSGFASARREHRPSAPPPFNWATKSDWPREGYGSA
jgi:hypothetical protein